MGGQKYKINGQHTSWAAYYLGEEEGVKPNRVLGRIRRMHYRCKDKAALTALYQTFDPAQSARSVKHVTAMSLHHIDGLTGLNQVKLNRIGGAVKLWAVDSPSARERLDESQTSVIVQQHIDVVMRVLEIWNQMDKFKPAKRQCVTAAALATFDKRPLAAKDFWLPVVQGTGMDDIHDPRLRLRNLLAEAAVKGHSKDRVYYTPEQLYRIAIYCWNKWRAGEKLRTTPRIPDQRPVIRS
jgi:hypothetical protein